MVLPGDRDARLAWSASCQASVVSALGAELALAVEMRANNDEFMFKNLIGSLYKSEYIACPKLLPGYGRKIRIEPEGLIVRSTTVQNVAHGNQTASLKFMGNILRRSLCTGITCSTSFIRIARDFGDVLS